MWFFSFSGDFEIQQFMNFCWWIEVNTKSFWRINWHSTTECWLKWQIHWQTYKWIASIFSITWSCKETVKGDLRMGSWKWICSLSSHYFQRSSLPVSKKLWDPNCVQNEKFMQISHDYCDRTLLWVLCK